MSENPAFPGVRDQGEGPENAFLAVLDIHVKTTHCSAQGAPAVLQTFGFRTFCAKSTRKMAPSSCLDARQMPADIRASTNICRRFPRCFGHSCKNYALLRARRSRSAPNIRIPHILREEHAQNGSILMFGRSSNVRPCSCKHGMGVRFPRCFYMYDLRDLLKIPARPASSMWPGKRSRRWA